MDGETATGSMEKFTTDMVDLVQGHSISIFTGLCIEINCSR